MLSLAVPNLRSSHLVLFNNTPKSWPINWIRCKSSSSAVESPLQHMVSSAKNTSLNKVLGKNNSASGSLAACTLSNNTVINIMNKYGDSGHPCLMPAFCLKEVDSMPCTITLKQGFA
eukprot:454450-Prorocentrum_lima.AAC.1